ncbi:MAG: hypothetical protein ACO3NZ_04650 [Pirellulales bacterium]
MRDVDDDDADDLDEPWDEADAWDEDEPTVPCPYCGDEMLEDAPQCFRCGNYISVEDRPRVKKPLWVVMTAILCLLMAAGWLLAR